jgi:8-oxo-dGTP pyrophosphatase MutT (NUDIX family)
MGSARISLSKEEIRSHLALVCPPEIVATAGPAGSRITRALIGAAHGTPAAVLIGLVGYDNGPTIILTERTGHLQNHPGEISFPGGKIEADDGGPADAALREAFEEIGLPPDRVEIIGCLPPHHTISHFRVYPFVGWVEPPVELTPDPHEVAGVFELPLAFVLDPANRRLANLVVGGVKHTFSVYEYADHRVWGATAGMLAGLSQALGGPTAT